MCEQGYITRDRASKELTGTKFSSNVKRLAKENEQLANALRPMLELKQQYGAKNIDDVLASAQDKITASSDELEEQDGI
jgi:hypothetical protein